MSSRCTVRRGFGFNPACVCCPRASSTRPSAAASCGLPPKACWRALWNERSTPWPNAELANNPYNAQRIGKRRDLRICTGAWHWIQSHFEYHSATKISRIPCASAASSMDDLREEFVTERTVSRSTEKAGASYCSHQLL